MKTNVNLSILPAGSKEKGSSRIRVYYLLDELSKYFEKLFLDNNFNKNADIVVFQKFINLDLLLKYRKKNVYTVFDVDDLFENTYDMVRFSDLVIVSTQFLKEKLSSLNENIIVVPNCLDIEDYNIPLKQNRNNTEKKLCWYGWEINSYILDKLNIRNLVTTISNVGDIKYSKDTIDDNIQLFDYVIIPQEKNEHTLSKTHCRLLKSLYLGVPVIASDMPEYRSLLKELDISEDYILKDLEQFKPTIKHILSGNITLKDIDFEKVRSKIIDNYSKEKIANSYAKAIKNSFQNRNLSNMQNLTFALSDYLRKKHIFNIINSFFSIQSNKKFLITEKKITLLGIKIKFKIKTK